MARGRSAKTAAKIDVCIVTAEVCRAINVTFVEEEAKIPPVAKRMNEELPELEKRMENESEREREAGR